MERVRLVALLALGALGLGFLSGTVVERVRFDVRRAEVLARLASETQRVHARLMALEPRTERDRAAGER
jgi:hypothetical protein